MARMDNRLVSHLPFKLWIFSNFFNNLGKEGNIFDFLLLF